MKYDTSELCDIYQEDVNVVEPLFSNFGGRSSFGGQIITVKCFEDNGLLYDLLEENGRGRVLLVDGGGSVRRALIDADLARLAVQNEWEGIVVYGSVRQVDDLEDLDIGYRARIYGYENRYEPTASVLHYGSASTGSRYNSRKTELSSSNNIYVIGKNMPLLQWILNLPFFLLGFGIKFLFFCKKRMGKLYLKGLAEGWKRTVGPVGKQAKVHFQWSHLWNYVKIQWQLYLNVFRILMKS